MQIAPSQILSYRYKSETITECMRLFNCQSVKNVADKRMRSFKQKYSTSSK